MPEQQEATAEVVVEEVSLHPEGIDAAALGEKMASRGYRPYSVQRAIRYALDRGQIERGPRFRLRMRKAA
jgi:hypothetical protein